MTDYENCKHGSTAPISILKRLPDSQAMTGRHRCTVCAFQKGFEDAQLGTFLFSELEQCQHKSNAPISVLKNLAWSQAGTGRHKCAACAYRLGFEAGANESTILVSLFKKKLEHLAHPTRNPESSTSNLILTHPPKYSKPGKSKPPSFKGNIVLERSYKEHKNIQLGRAGELLVINYERETLISSGRNDLADKIVHISEIEGDGAGYDIKSFQLDGSSKYIEVKTTRGSASTPFFITWTELEYSKQNPNEYFLYRVYDYDSVNNSGRLFVIHGKVNESFNLSPTVFRASRS